MPLVAPFRALRYAPALQRDLPLLIAPPYDVIPPERRQVLASRHPRNIVHLDLPEAGGGADPYRAAARALETWVRDGTLVRDERPAFYLLEQRFPGPSGGTRVRRGFFARLRLAPYEAGSVIPHERTFERPREDRQRLLAATRTHFSAVFVLHPDPGAAAAKTLADLAGASPAPEIPEDDGARIRMVRIESGPATRTLARALEESWVLIADGHHRYESALAYCEARRAAGKDDAGHVLAFLCSLEDPGLAIFPIHRALRPPLAHEPARIRERLASFFSLSPVPGGEALRMALDAAGERPGTFGLVFPGEEGHWLAAWRDGAGLDRPALAEIPEALRRLDVILLHRLVLEETLGIGAAAQATGTHLDYVKDEGDLFERVRDGRAALGIVMRPTPMRQVVEVTRQGLRLPQKSTYFFPKVPSGLVLDPLDA